MIPWEDVAPVGSEWYSVGHHWKVMEVTTKEGEPAVRLRRTVFSKRSPRRKHNEKVVLVRLLDRHGTRKTPK